jgi:hypothetical protein
MKRRVRDAGVAGSNPATPTIIPIPQHFHRFKAPQTPAGAPVEPQDRETVLRWHQRISGAIAGGESSGRSRCRAANMRVLHDHFRCQTL